MSEEKDKQQNGCLECKKKKDARWREDFPVERNLAVNYALAQFGAHRCVQLSGQSQKSQSNREIRARKARRERSRGTIFVIRNERRVGVWGGRGAERKLERSRTSKARRIAGSNSERAR